MAQTMTRAQMKAAADESLYATLPPRELLRGLGEVIHRRVPLTSIHRNPDQPRSTVDESSPEFEDLVGSIRAQGLIQPISLWQVDEDNEERFTIIAGERRWRAFRRLAEENPNDFSRIPATITVLTGEQPHVKALMQGLVENVVREDLKPGDRAASLQRLKDWTGWTWDAIAERMGIGRVRVLELKAIAKHEPVRDAVNEGAITQKQAIAIAQGIRDTELAAAIVEHAPGMDIDSTRQVIRRARSMASDTPAKERVRRAVAETRGTPSIGTPPVTATAGFPITSAGKVVGSVVDDYVLLTNTALAAVRPRVQRMRREEVAAMLQQFCEQTAIWPGRPSDAENGAVEGVEGEPTE
jgi:ParB/RepB/Spo0J family partition protein